MSTISAPLSALVDLIQDSVKVIISEYAQIGQTVPSLDSVSTGPFDSPEKVTPELRRAIEIVEASCAQLSFTIASPGHTITNKAYGFEEPACMRVVTESRIADLLLDRPEGLHVDVLAKQSGLDADKLGRILRLLATKHCFNEGRPNVFANNRLSMKLLSNDPVSSLVGHLTDEVFKASAYLGDTLADPKSGSSSRLEDAAFQRAFGSTAFDYYLTPEGKPKTDRFAQAMVGWGQVTGKSMLPKVYPWDELLSDTQITICDVGGGNGHVTLDLAKAFPRFKVVLQDQPGVIEQGKEYWAKELPSAVENKMVEFAPINIFKDVPVTGCDFYYIRHVLHDWPYAECLTILRNVRKATKATSKLLIHELVLQYQTRDRTQESLYTQAPEPLLANYGMGRVRIYQQDLNMMGSMNSKERTLQEFIDMGKEAGFKFVKMWDAGEAGIVEFIPA